MATSNMFLNGACFAEDLMEGEEIIVSWEPKRICRFRYLGNNRFEVVEAINAQISVGDTFCCDAFINGAALYVNQLTHGGCTGLMYAAGKVGGIQFKRVLTHEDIEKERLQEGEDL